MNASVIARLLTQAVMTQILRACKSLSHSGTLRARQARIAPTQT
jgi:hypothetical protein